MIPADFDTEELQKVMRLLRQMSGQFNAEISQAINEGGKQLYDHSVLAIADYYHIPPEAVRYGISQRMATTNNPEYTQIGEAEKIPYVVWRTANDEKVCKICGPREGQIYSVEDAQEIWPAHPNCRCRLEPLDMNTAMQSVADEALPGAMEAASVEILANFSDLFGRIRP